MRRFRRPLILVCVLAAAFLFFKLIELTPYFPFLDNLIPPRVQVPLKIAATDDNGNGVSDALDLVSGARREVSGKTVYDASYCRTGYPPQGKGACSDVVWRAFREAGCDLKSMVDEDISACPQAYGETGANPDPRIDFRRVRNLQVFFRRHSILLTTEVCPGDVDNLVQWQAGDIVVFGKPYPHIAIVSDRRLGNGVPLIIHNAGPRASEDSRLTGWPSPITHHFRYFN